MRRAGQNPTDIEVQDMLNKVDDGSGVMDLDDFFLVMREKSKEVDMEIHFKDAFRVFSKDKDGEKIFHLCFPSIFVCHLLYVALCVLSCITPPQSGPSRGCISLKAN